MRNIQFVIIACILSEKFEIVWEQRTQTLTTRSCVLRSREKDGSLRSFRFSRSVLVRSLQTWSLKIFIFPAGNVVLSLVNIRSYFFGNFGISFGRRLKNRDCSLRRRPRRRRCQLVVPYSTYHSSHCWKHATLPVTPNGIQENWHNYSERRMQDFLSLGKCWQLNNHIHLWFDYDW